MSLEAIDTFCARWMFTMLHFLWQGVVIGLVVVAVGRILRTRPPVWRYTLYTTAMLSFPVCVATTFALLESPRPKPEQAWADRPQERGPIASSESAATLAAETTPAMGSAADRPGPSESGSTAANTRSQPSTEVVRPPRLEARTISAATPTPSRHDWQSSRSTYLAGIYLVGVCYFLFRLSMAVCGGHRLRASAKLLNDPQLLKVVRRQCEILQLKCMPAIAFCERVAVPTVVGFLRPMVLLPASFLGLDPRQFSAIIGHELAHIRRYDLLVNLFQRVLESLLFFHPAVWYVSRRMRVERELCCDDLVVACGNDRMQYARALLEMAEACQAARRASLVAVAATGENESQLERRILRLMTSESLSNPRLTRSGMFTFTLMLLSLALAPALVYAWHRTSPTPQPDATVDTAPNGQAGNQDLYRPENDVVKTSTDSSVGAPQGKQLKTSKPKVDPTTFRGLQLADLSSTSDERTLTGLFQETPAGSGNHEWAPSTCFMPFDGPFSVLYVADKRLFFLRHEVKPKHVYYGPIKGNPLDKLKMKASLLKRMKQCGTAGNARITLGRMARSGNKELASVALRLLTDILSDKETLHDVAKRGPAAGQAERNLEFALNVLERYGAKLAKEQVSVAELRRTISALEEQFDAAMKYAPDEQYTEAGYLQKSIPRHAPVSWGPVNNGLRLGLVAKTPVSVKHGNLLYPFELIIENVSRRQIRFQVGYPAEWLRAVVTDLEGNPIRTEFGDVGSSLHPGTSYWRLKPGEKYHVCGNRLTFASPDTRVETTAFRRMDWLITRVRAEPGKYLGRYVLPINQWRTRRGKGEWFGQLTSSTFTIRVAAADGVEEKVRHTKNALTKNADGRFLIRFDKTSLKQIAQDYASEVGYDLRFAVEPKGTVTYRSRRPYGFNAYHRLINIELQKAGYYLADGNTKKSFVLKLADEVAAERFAEIKKANATFDRDLSVLNYQAFRTPEPNAPAGPAYKYTLRAARDLTATQVGRLLRRKFADKIAFVRGSDSTHIRCDAYAIRGKGKLQYGGGLPLKRGQTFEVFYNQLGVEWNAYDPNPPVVTVRGTITDDKGRPVSNLAAEYMIFGNSRFDRPLGGKLEVDGKGNFRVPIRTSGWLSAPSKFYVMAKAKGFAPVQVASNEIRKSKDQRLDIQLTSGFEGILQLDTGDGPEPRQGVIEVKAFDLRHSPLFTLKTQGNEVRIPNCGDLPLILIVNIPGFQVQTFRDVKFVAKRATRLKLKATQDGGAKKKKAPPKTTSAPVAPSTTAPSKEPEVRMLEHLNVRDVRYAKSGDSIVSLATEKTVTIRTWDARTGKLKSEVALETKKHGNFFLNGTLRFSGDGKVLAAIVNGRIGMWDAKTGKSIPIAIPEKYQASKLAISHDGKRLATAEAIGLGGFRQNTDVEVVVWDPRSGEQLSQFQHLKGLQIHDLAFSPDSTLLGSASQENGVFVWELATKKTRHHFLHGDLNAKIKHPKSLVDPKQPADIAKRLLDIAKRQVLSVAFHPDNHLLAVADMYGVKLWDIRTGKLRHALDAPFRYGRSFLRFSRSGKYVARASADSVVIVWSADDGKEKRRIKTGSGCVAFSPDETHVAIGRSDRKQALSVWNLK